MVNVLEEIKKLSVINDIVLKGEIVLFGSDQLADLPLYELINQANLPDAVYNRALKGMTLDDANALLQASVLDIKPSKVFLDFGECDEKNNDSLKKYLSIIKRIRAALPKAEIYFIGIPETDENCRKFNAQVKAFVSDKRMRYISLTDTAATKSEKYKREFKELACFFAQRPITFNEAYALSEL